MAKKRPEPTQRFFLRLWREALDQDRHEWRGELLHLDSGEVRYFRSAQTLQTRLWRMLLQFMQEQDERREGE